MKQVSISHVAAGGSGPHKARIALREQIPLRDLSDCLLAAYEGVSQRAFRLYQARGRKPGSDLKDWKDAERDLLAAMPVDLAESEKNFYALASVPGYAAAEISVAVEDCWLLISGYGHCFEQTELCQQDARFHEDGAISDPPESGAAGPSYSNDSIGPGEGFQECVVRRPFCVVELGCKVDAARSVVVLANGLLAVRMAKSEVGVAEPSAD